MSRWGSLKSVSTAARSWMADNAVPFELAEACLAHTVGNAVVQAYQRSSMLASRRPIMSAWANLRLRLRRRQRGATASIINLTRRSIEP